MNTAHTEAARVGMVCLIIAESAMFTIFVVAYLFYLGKSVSGPTPKEVLELPIAGTLCLLSSSVTVMLAVRALLRGELRRFQIAWLATIALGVVFLVGTGRDWARLFGRGLLPDTNLFGTTYYALVGLHAFHVTVGLLLLSAVALLTLLGPVEPRQRRNIDVVSLYWHFVDAVWIVVFTVVYLIGR